MADGVVLDPGAGGAQVATDEIGAFHHQRVKVQIGADGSASDVHSGNPLPINDAGGSLTVDGSVGLTGAIPAGNNNIGDVDVASLPAGSQAGVAAKTSDYDSGAGTDTVPMQGIALPASGGAVQGGTNANPIRTDPTGTTSQPISGIVGVHDNGGVLSVDDNGSTLSVDDGAGSLTVDDGGSSLTVDGSVSLAAAIPAGTNNIGDVDVLSLPALPAGSNNIGDVDVASLPAASSATITRVNDTASSVQLVASNASRKGLYIHNDSTQALKIKYGTTASATDYTAKIPPDGFWEMPTAPVYTGRVDGIWAADASGAAQITEL